MPTTPKRARKLMAKGRAVPKWNKGIFGIRMLDREEGKVQAVCVGIDTGSKKEAFCVKTEAATLLNIQADAVQHVKDRVELRRLLRRGRRYRKTPYRANRKNRARGGLPPSTKARWQLKLRVLNWLGSMFPITDVVIEDVMASTKKGKRGWNVSFSPLQVGKQWLYGEVSKRWNLYTVKGYETAELRVDYRLKKLKNKLSDSFFAHCVDAFALATATIGGDGKPDNTDVLTITPLRLHRRALHRANPQKGGVRTPYGGTRSEGFKRGSLVRHVSSGRAKSHGLCFVGGASKGKVSLHSLSTGKRLTQGAKPNDLTPLAYMGWR